jgi:hypothetical protein
MRHRGPFQLLIPTRENGKVVDDQARLHAFIIKLLVEPRSALLQTGHHRLEVPPTRLLKNLMLPPALVRCEETNRTATGEASKIDSVALAVSLLI